jgi:hypothetical protein
LRSGRGRLKSGTNLASLSKGDQIFLQRGIFSIVGPVARRTMHRGVVTAVIINRVSGTDTRTYPLTARKLQPWT